MNYEIEFRKIFPAKHKRFYDSYEKWRVIIKKETQIIDGVYILFAKRPIHRLIGADNQGILYIGKGAGIVDYKRIGNLINSINDTDKSHSGGVRLNPDLKKIYPIREMKIEVQLTKHYEELERQLLKDYIEKYGELPPLNRVLS